MDATSTAGPVLAPDTAGVRLPVGTALFRREVLEYQATHRQWGSVIELRPVSARALSWASVLVAAFAVLFLCTAQYARKEPVAGYLRPSLGTAKVFVPHAGVIRDVRVTEGDVVKKGQPLMTVETAQISAAGRDLNQASLDTLLTQRAMIARQIQAEETRTESERRRLNALIDGQRREVELLVGQIRRQDDRITLGRTLLHSGQTLAAKDLIPDADFKRRQQDLLDQERIRDSLDQQLISRQNQLLETQMSLEQLATVRNDKIQSLRNDLSSIDQRSAETEARQAYVIVAPASGKVATLQAAPGKPADLRQLQMTIVPTGSTLMAELLVPSRASGFVEVGQPVRLLYEAYPYQKYGTYTGRIEAVAGTVIEANEFMGPLKLAEPAYRVSVALDSPNVMVNGRAVPLRPDMVLRADIVLEKRTILNWLLSPVLNTRNAIDADPLMRILRDWIGPLYAAAHVGLTHAQGLLRQQADGAARDAAARGEELPAPQQGPVKSAADRGGSARTERR